jgi:hypothetical protein
MISIDSVTIDATGWTHYESTAEQKVWLNHQFRESLSIHYFPTRPDLLADLSQPDVLRDAHNQAVASRGGEVVELDVMTLAGVHVLRQILKLPLTEEGRGRVYIATFTLPFADFSYVIKVQCPEIRITGIRETAMFEVLRREGKIDLSTLPQEEGGVTRLPPEIMQMISTATDDPAYDDKFPNHPVSRARVHLAQIEASLTVDDDVRESPPFVLD